MDKTCKTCGKKLGRKIWQGTKRKIRETGKRWKERQFCDNVCRSKHLAITNAGSNNYFYGKHLIPHNMKYEPEIKMKTGKGYIQIRRFDANGNRIVRYEHRELMERHIGRALDPQEVVHHIDNDPKNNVITNLILFANNAEHRKCHSANYNKI